MTPAEFAKARALCEAATPGPWALEPNDANWSFVVSEAGERNTIGWLPTVIDATIASDADRSFIAAVRTLLPAALDEIERLQDLLADFG